MGTVINGKEKYDINISGQTVVTTVSGDWVDISGESVFVYISGGSLQVDISGQTVLVDISGQSVTVDISGQTVIADISGQTVVTDISGQTVLVDISGQTVFVDISGQTVVTDISGQTVLVDISGQIVTADISGESVFVYISGGEITAVTEIIPLATFASGNTAISLSTVPADDAYLDYVAYHGDAAATAPENLTVNHTMIEGGVYNIFTVNMGANAIQDLVYYPDTPTVLISGDTVQVAYPNVSGIAWNVRILTRR